MIAATGLVILLNLDSNRRFFRPCDLEIWWMTSKNNRTPLLYYIKLCASFQIHRWIQTGVTVRKRAIQVEIGDVLSRVTLKFDRWPWKTIGHLLDATLGFLCHIKAIGKFNCKLQSRNSQLGSKSGVTLKFNRWPWKTIERLFYVASSFVHHFIAISEY